MTETPIERMRTARKLAGLSQEQAAQQLDVSVKTYSRWESGETEGWMGNVAQIAAVFDIDPSEITPAASPDRLSSLEDQVVAMRGEVRELRDLLLDPAELRARVEALLAAEGVPSPKRSRRR